MASALMVRGTNPKTIRHSLAGTTAVTFTFAASALDSDGTVNCVLITASVDTELTAKWDAAAPTSDGSNSAPVAGYSQWVGPSYGPMLVMSDSRHATLGVYNLGAATSVLHAYGFYAPTN